MKVATFSMRLATVMERKKISRSELQKRTGISRQQIYKYLHDLATPKAENVEILANALEVSEAYLLGYDVNENGEANTQFNNVLLLDERYPKMSKAIGTAVSELRQKNGDTINDLANKLGRKPTTIAHFEDGTELLPLLTAWRICELYNYSDELLKKDIFFHYNKLKKEE